MSQLLPEAKVQVQTIEATKLPPNSNRTRGFHQARFQPFDVLGVSDTLRNNQLNWTNLFLLNNLGHRTLSSVDINAITHLSGLQTTTVVEEEQSSSSLKEVKALAKHMSDEYFAGIKEKILQIATDSDLENAKGSVREALKEAELGGRLSIMEAKLDRFEKLLNEIAKRIMMEH